MSKDVQYDQLGIIMSHQVTKLIPVCGISQDDILFVYQSIATLILRILKSSQCQSGIQNISREMSVSVKAIPDVFWLFFSTIVRSDSAIARK